MTAMRLHRYPSPSGGIALGKMGVGATLMSAAKTAKDYVQDGLIAMWDGIENAGWGVHDAEATVWKDLVGSNDLQVASVAKWGDNCLSTTTEVNGLAYKSVSLANTMRTVEAGWMRTTTSSARIVFSCGTTANTPSKRGFIVHTAGNHVRGAAYSSDGPVAIAPSVTAKCTASFVFPDTTGFVPSAAFLNGRASSARGHDTWGSSSILGFSNYTVSAYQFVGDCYFARIYSRALTADEIAANYAIDKERFNLP